MLASLFLILRIFSRLILTGLISGCLIFEPIAFACDGDNLGVI